MPNPFPPQSLVTAYLRDSGGDAQDLSVIQQEAEIKKWCGENQLILNQIFTDEALPGSSTVGRAGFLAMITHFSNGAQERGIIVWKYSRFAREIDDAQFYKADLRRKGYVIHSLNENLPEGLDGRLFEAAIDWMNARFLQDLSEDVKRGLHHNVKTHGAIGGTPPRGFRRGEPIHLGTRRNGQPHIVHRWEPDPELVPLVKRAFRMRINGASYPEIEKETGLYRSKTGWHHFFSNPIYKGELHYGHQVIPDYCEAIVDPQTWEAVQKMNTNPLLEKGVNPGVHPRAKNSDYILTGLLTCALCGAPMTGESIHNKKKKAINRYYKCQRYGHGCQARRLPKEYAELVILDEVTRQILSVENITALRDEAAKTANTQVTELRAKLDLLQDERTKLRLQIDRLTDSLANMGSSPAVTQKLKQKELDQVELVLQIDETEKELERLTNLPTDKQIQDLAAKLQFVLSTSDRPSLRRWLRELVHHIEASMVLDQKKITGIIYYYDPGDLENLEFTSTGRSHRRDSNP